MASQTSSQVCSGIPRLASAAVYACCLSTSNTAAFAWVYKDHTRPRTASVVTKRRGSLRVVLSSTSPHASLTVSTHSALLVQLLLPNQHRVRWCTQQCYHTVHDHDSAGALVEHARVGEFHVLGDGLLATETCNEPRKKREGFEKRRI